VSGSVDTARAVTTLAARRRLIALALAALAALLALSACGGGEDGGPSRVEGDGHSFEYPEGWSQLEAEFVAEAPNNTASVSVGPEETGVNLVTVGSFEVPVEVNADNLEAYREDITAGVEQLFTQADGSIEEGPIPITVGGLSGYRFEGTSTTPIEDAGEVHTRSIQVYDGTRGFFINCQYQPDAQEEVLAGCQEVLDSFEVAE
jgi:hypothetical protein